MHELVIILKKEYASQKENVISLLRSGDHNGDFFPKRKFNITKQDTLPFSKRQFILRDSINNEEVLKIKKHKFVQDVGVLTSADDYLTTVSVDQDLIIKRDQTGQTDLDQNPLRGNWALYRHTNLTNDFTVANSKEDRNLTYTYDDDELGQDVDLIIQDSGIVNRSLSEFRNEDGTFRVVPYQWHELFPDPDAEHGFVNIYARDAGTEFLKTGKFDYNDSRFWGDHANQCAGCAAGNTYGFARKANIYTMPYLYVNTPYNFEAIRLFHKNKVDNGITRPTIVSASWGSITILRNVTSNYFRGLHVTNPVHFNSYHGDNIDSGRGLPAGISTTRGGPGGIEGSMNDRGGMNSKFGATSVASRGRNQWYEPLLNSLTEDLTDEGVIYISAAGNSRSKIAEVYDMDYDNFITRGIFAHSRDNASTLGLPVFYNRGSGNISFDSIVVGSLDCFIRNYTLSGTNLERKSYFSERGSRVDTFAAGHDVVTIDKLGKKVLKNGTSFSCPHVAGMTAILAGKYPGFTPRQARSYWRNRGISNSLMADNSTFPRQNPDRSQTVNVSGDPKYFLPDRVGSYNHGVNDTDPWFALLDAPNNIAYLDKTIDPRTIVDEGTGLIALSTHTDPTISAPITKRTYNPPKKYKPAQAYRYYKIQFFANVSRNLPERVNSCGIELLDEDGKNVFGEPLPNFGVFNFVSEEEGYNNTVIFDEGEITGGVPGTMFFERTINNVPLTITLRTAFTQSFVPKVGDPNRDTRYAGYVIGYTKGPNKLFTSTIGGLCKGASPLTQNSTDTVKYNNSVVEIDLGRQVKLGSIRSLAPRHQAIRMEQRSEFFDVSGSNDPSFTTGVEKVGELNFGLHTGNNQYIECITDDGTPAYSGPILNDKGNVEKVEEPEPEPVQPVPPGEDPILNPPKEPDPLPTYPGFFNPELFKEEDFFDFGFPLLLISPAEQQPELLNFTPEEDDLTQGVNKTIPSRVEKLSPKIKRNYIIATVGGIRGLICNKIEGALNLASGIKNGSFNFIPSLKDFNLNTFFEGPLQGLSNKINTVVADYDNILQSFKNNEKVIVENNILELIDIETQNVERYEATQLTSNSFNDTINSIQNLSNKSIRDIERDPLARKSLKDKLCESAEFELINNALVSKSVTAIAKEQEELIKKSNNLVDKNKLVELTSKIERTLLP